jgi:rubrerythrin
MSKGLRLSEKWFNRGLWLVAFVFAWFLIGLGDTVIRDLPRVETYYVLDDFIDKNAATPIRQEIKTLHTQSQKVADQLDQAQLQLNIRSNDYHAARTTFDNWVSTRNVTNQANQDDELIQRTQSLDQLKSLERDALTTVENLKQQQLTINQNINTQQTALSTLEDAAQTKLYDKQKQQDIRAFLYRLALTLPLLLIAAWLFKKKRQTPYWPFVWGFIIFSGFAFFVELVPYLPSYGGYVRYLVGIVLTIVIGRQAIISLNKYLEKQRLAEAMSNAERRGTLSYDIALARLAKNVCPGCERPVDLKNTDNDFCPHCGIGLHDYCGSCNGRKSAFAKFCHKCGAVA